MTNTRKKTIKITCLLLEIMCLIWKICFNSTLTSCNKNKMYTESETKYKTVDIKGVN